jgi:hypothetical protein
VKLREFYLDKEMKKDVFNHITFYAKERLEESAMKGEPTDWFKPLIEILSSSDKSLSDMFEVTENKPKINRAK